MADKTDKPKMSSDGDDLFLDAFFEAERADTAALSSDLFARILDDAETVQAEHQSPDVPAKPSAPWWQQSISVLIKAWPSAAGLATATLAGVWIGYSPPEAIETFTSSFVNLTETAGIFDVMAEFDTTLELDG
jgi:hypothetical protein